MVFISFNQIIPFNNLIILYTILHSWLWFHCSTGGPQLQCRTNKQRPIALTMQLNTIVTFFKNFTNAMLAFSHYIKKML
jgi:hypothetical protein